MLEHADELAEALGRSYGQRPEGLTKAFDIMPLVALADELREGVAEWMEPTPVPGGFIQKKPLGVVGVNGAWNFPYSIAINPALDALAAGNRVMIKVSDVHPEAGRLLAEAIATRLDESEVAVIVGDLRTAEEFSSLPFDHIVFTGSPRVGRIIGSVAGGNLVPTTLELGGKNPVVVARDADLALAAHRIAGTRMLNAGQICLCPDYVFVPREHIDDFVPRLATELDALFPDLLTDPGAVSIVNDANYDRVLGLIDDARGRGARVVTVGSSPEPSRAKRMIPATLLLDVPPAAAISQQEIFGPVLVNVVDGSETQCGVIVPRMRGEI
jgi:coniferyl-aldehyde dehydrogenase